jgi:murein DD-endopeptidase MepM/ murein hydrolase activator NlpD
MNAAWGMALLVLLTATAMAWPGAGPAPAAGLFIGSNDPLYATASGIVAASAGWRSGDAVQAAAQCPNPYTVRSGETLYSIAAKCRVSAARIKQANRMKSDRVWVNQRLIIPAAPAIPQGVRPPIHPTPQP